MTQDDDKRAAALAAVEEVRDGMLVGLGTGSTASHAIAEIGRRCAEGLRIEAVVTSHASEAQARALGITLRAFEEVSRIDLAIDGADEIDPRLRAIKGAGGAMLREKVVAAAARRMIVIADGSKRVDRLGTAAVPVEVLPFARGFVTSAIAAIGGLPTRRGGTAEPYRTDQGNLVLDCRFDPLDDADILAQRLAAIPGVLGHGLFLDEIDVLYLAERGIVRRIERPAAIS